MSWTSPRPPRRRSFATAAAALLAVAGLASAAIEQSCRIPPHPADPGAGPVFDPDAALTDALLDLQAAAGLLDPRTPYVHGS